MHRITRMMEVCRDMRPLRSLSIAAWLIFLMIAGVPGVEVRLGFAQVVPPAIIDNGTVQLGINPEGHLNVHGPASSGGVAFVGLRFVPTNNEATAPGCLCEGWGVANAAAGDQFSGYANVSTDGGVVGLVVQPGTGVTVPTGHTKAESVGSAFKSIVTTTNGRLKVTHDYHPSASSNLYQVDVTIENIGVDPIGDLRYRRVMDWDVEPTAFNEFVTGKKGTATDLTFFSNNGFATANPLVPGGNLFTCPVNGDFEDCGPADHGALFDFSFGTLAPGGNKAFRIFYGAAATEAAAMAALAAVGAEAFSFGQPNTIGGPTLGTPNTFIFAFAGIGGTPVIPAAIITTAASGLNFPFGVAVNSVYIADRNNHKVWKIGSNPTDLILVAGTGEAGYNGDNIAAATAQLNSPTGVAVSNGNLFIADSGNHVIRNVNLSTGIITTVAGVPQKNGVAVNGGPATLAELFGPRGVATDGAGNIYIADTMNQQVRKVDATTGNISSVAGVAGETGNNDGSVAEARLNSPLGVAVDSSGSIVYIADEGNDLIRVVDEGGVETVEADTLDSPSGVAVDGNGNLYIADTDNHRIQRVSGESVTTVAGTTGVSGYSGDGGPATAATLNTPVAVAVDSTGRFLYIADLINNVIRKVDFTPDVIP